ncbi:MAG: menaquinone biosynthesis protein [Deltaproteobacteria bacterium]|nr:menaquinone biosynthesis protein [Deltaproteobacteria bacterium]
MEKDKREREQSARIGMVNYINMAPIYESWKKREHPAQWHLIEAPPAILNRMLAAGDLDLGFVSSHEYCVRPELYRILADLSISAKGPVGSVFLFSRIDPGKLDGCPVLLSGQSQTSVFLVKIILEEFYGVKPRYSVGDVESEMSSQAQALLAIGDQALRLVGNPQFPYQLDLGAVWRQHTGLPFVFSVCAVREDFCRRAPETLALIQQEFASCVREGRENLEAICQVVAPRIPMHPDECYVYLRAIEYDLGAEKQLALERFSRYLIARGEGSAQALPLKIVEHR